MKFFEGVSFPMSGVSKNYLYMHSHVPSYYGVQYNHSGSLRLRLDHGVERKVDGPWAFITRPGVHFEYGPVSGPRWHNYVCFQGERTKRYIDAGLLPCDTGRPLIKINFPDKFHGTMLALVSELREDRKNSNRATLLLEDLLLQLHEQDIPGRELPSHQAPLLSRLLDDIRAAPNEEWDFEREAAGLSVTLTHFRRLFKQFSGTSPQQFLIQQRLRLAADMLVNSSEPVAGIAAEVGVENEFYFSRLFKKKYKLSPLGYRREFAGRPSGKA